MGSTSTRRVEPIPFHGMIELSERIRVGLVQINTEFRWTGSRSNRRSSAPADAGAAERDYWEALPYSIGLLQAYAQKHAQEPEHYEYLLPVCRRMPVDQAVERLRGAHVVGFSAYVWNIQLSLAIAQRIKQQDPRTLIVFGGHQVPARLGQTAHFLRRYPFVDMVCHGEGEQVFLDILEKSETRNWEGIPSVSYLDGDGTCVGHPPAPPIRDLSTIPSPYLEGVFEPLMRANPHKGWIALWETNRGCPFSCSFCDWGCTADGKVYKFDQERLFKELDWMGEHSIRAIAGCDANFGMAARDLDLVRHVVDMKRKCGYPQLFFENNAKGATERAYQVQKLLAQSGLWQPITISLQSTNPETLKNVRRDNIPMASFRDLQGRYVRDRIATYTDMILGLPGETYDSFADGVSQVIGNGQHNRIFFFNCLILPNAEMGNREYQQAFGIRAVRQKAVEMHGPLVEDEVPEFMETVIATAAMPPQDWVKAKVFSWTSDLLYFGRLVPIPFVLLHELHGVTYRELIEAVADADPRQYRVLAGIQATFREKAQEIQRGGPEYVPAQDWLGRWWPVYQSVLIKLVTDDDLDSFYGEIESVLTEYMHARSITSDPLLLHEAIEFNQRLFQVPFQWQDLRIELAHNIWEYYSSVLAGIPIPLESSTCRYYVVRTRPVWPTWEHWLQHLMDCHWVQSLYWYPIQSIKARDTRQKTEETAA